MDWKTIIFTAQVAQSVRGVRHNEINFTVEFCYSPEMTALADVKSARGGLTAYKVQKSLSQGSGLESSTASHSHGTCI